jgi:putative ABC transport system permease protein
MFWRILGELFRASRGRLAVALLAIASGAAVTTALLNLNWDAERKVSAEFRALGANVVILPSHSAGDAAESALLDTGLTGKKLIERENQIESPQAPNDDPYASPLMSEGVIDRLVVIPGIPRVIAAPYLYVVATVSAGKVQQQVIVAGTWLDVAQQLSPWWKITGQPITNRNDLDDCLIGRNVAKQLNLSPGSAIALRYDSIRTGTHTATLTVKGIVDSGGQEDSQVITNILATQRLTNSETDTNHVGSVQVSIPGTSREVLDAVTRISAALPDVEVRPVPQISHAEGLLLPRIRGLIFFMVALILVLTTLCVFASMAALAMERRRDVGLMKAIGGSMSRIIRIFLTEAGALGLAGALIGYVAGIFLSRWIGDRAFHVAISARPEVLPLVIALMVGVALAGALPLRLLGNIRPAEIMRGE